MGPGRLAQVGLDAGHPLLNAASQMLGFTSFFAVAVLMVSWLLVLIAFFILAVQLFVTLIEFKPTTLASFILIPFALDNKIAFLAEKVLGNVVASGVKVMVLAVSLASAPDCLAVHHHLWRRPADDRAGVFCRARRTHHARPRRPASLTVCSWRAAAWHGRCCRS
nr:type IV secretion system protein [Bradyrhizobium centrosematis]